MALGAGQWADGWRTTLGNTLRDIAADYAANFL